MVTLLTHEHVCGIIHRQCIAGTAHAATHTSTMATLLPQRFGLLMS